MLKRLGKALALTPELRGLLDRPLFYRLSTLDLFLPGLVAGALGAFFGRDWLAKGDPQFAGRVLLASFVILMIALNRFAWLFSGRGSVKQGRLRLAIDRLLTAGHLDILPWASRARLPLDEVLLAIDQYMAEEYHLGYLDIEKMRLVLSDQPLNNRRCPVCRSILSDSMVVDKVCGLCGSMLYH